MIFESMTTKVLKTTCRDQTHLNRLQIFFLRGYHQCCQEKIIAIIVDTFQGFFLLAKTRNAALGPDAKCKLLPNNYQLNL